MLLRTGPFHGERRNGTASAASLHTTLSGDRARLRRPQAAQETASGSGDRELAFLGNPFEGFGRAFDPILAIVTIGRKQADHLIVAPGGRSCNVAGSNI